MNLFVFTDGGARGNPGPAAIGVFITSEDKKEIVKIGKKIGFATNNVAEYKAILEGLSYLSEKKDKLGSFTKISFFLDSELASRQLSGLYKVKNKNLQELLLKIRVKEEQLGMPISYNYIRREKNKVADKLVNLALDNKL